MQETQIIFPGGEDPLEKEMATHSSILAWKIPWTEKSGRQQFMESQSQTRLSMHASTWWGGKGWLQNDTLHHFGKDEL